jgi:hypothetical protein
MPLNRGAGRFRTAAITVVDGLHLAQASEGGLQHPVPGCLGDCVVERKCELIELIRLVNRTFRLINKLLQPVPVPNRGSRSSEGSHGRLDRALRIEHLLGADTE